MSRASSTLGRYLGIGLLLGLVWAIAGCGGSEPASTDGQLKVVATTSFLRDIAQNVAGTQFEVVGLIPLGADPHGFQPTPQEMKAVATSDLVIVNGANLEGSLADTIRDVGGDFRTVVASKGITPRTPQAGEPAGEDSGEIDPHFWLDPVLAVTYVRTISAAFQSADPAHADTYRENARAYIAKLRQLDRSIAEQVETVPVENRKLVMNHASHGYYADRYGFRIVGTVLPSVSSEATASAGQLARLVTAIEREHVRAIFVEIEENPGLAEQIAADAHVRVVTDLLDHSLTEPDGPAPNYIAMMQYDTRLIVAALK